MKIAVIGGGHVGLPVAVGLARIGHQVVCYEKDGIKRDLAARGKAPFFDEGMDNALAAGIKSGALKFCLSTADAVADADVVFIAVPVGSGADGANDLHSAAFRIAANAPPRCVLAVKSTVSPGTCSQLERALGNKISVTANPEFLRQRQGLIDFLKPSRIVVGADDKYAAKVMRDVYEPIVAGGAKYIQTSCVSAEIAKLAANMFLAARVTLINEIADVCEMTGGDIDDVQKIIAADKRIGGRYLQPGLGFGGTCLPKDGRLLIESAERACVAMPAAENVFAGNLARPGRIAGRIAEMLPARSAVAAWGLGYKPGADDMRGSPAFSIIKLLCERGIKVFACRLDAVDGMPEEQPSELCFYDTRIETLAHADMLVVLGFHSKFSRMPIMEIQRAMKGNMVFDCAGIFCREQITKAGLSYYAIGGR